MTRVYEIRRDLEHEDADYEAGVEDCIYVFKTCIEAVLSRDPIDLIRVVEVKQIVEAPTPVVPDVRLVEDYEHAPDPRQEEIQRFLISTALDEQQPDLVRQNAFTALQMLSAYTRNAVKISVAAHFQEKVGRRPLVQLEVRVANAAGVFPYIRRAQRTQFFESFYEQMKRIGHEWRAHAAHGELLSTLSEAGGLSAIPEGPRKKMVKWLVLAYMGEPGGYGTMGQNRRVFYSNTAAPLVEELLHTSRETIREDVRALQDDRDIRRASSDEHVARRYHQLLDLVEE